ncbi:MAG: outer membrane beta-barrel domain-containing protein [Deltaproteobacteria bacterium]|nr:outer membrane beta-barrel domain-containing protein [Deltaproteobacteria bacterium]
MRKAALLFSVSILGWIWVESSAWAQPAPAGAGSPETPEATQPVTPDEAGPVIPGSGPAMPGSGPVTPGQVGSSGGGGTGAAAASQGTKSARGEKQYWKDIKVVSRKLILKQQRVELFLYPMGVTLNDNLIRHWFLGAELNYFLSDAMSVGIGGHYYLPEITQRAYLMGLQQRVLPTLNKYYFTTTANFNYNWMYGKFALHNKFIQQFGGYVGAGVGLTMTAVIPRRAGDSSWNNYNFTILFPAFGLRMFISKWLTLNLGIRLYIMRDNFEASNRLADDDPNLPANYNPKDHAAHRWIPNLVFNLGVSFFLPPSFKYTTFR